MSKPESGLDEFWEQLCDNEDNPPSWGDLFGDRGLTANVETSGLENNPGCVPAWMRFDKEGFPEQLPHKELVTNLHAMFDATNQLLFAGSYGSKHDVFSPDTGWFFNRNKKPDQYLLSYVLRYDSATREIMKYALAPVYEDIGLGMPVVDMHISHRMIFGDLPRTSHYRTMSFEDDSQELQYCPDESITRNVISLLRNPEPKQYLDPPFGFRVRRSMHDGQPMYVTAFDYEYHKRAVGFYSGRMTSADKWDSAGLLNFVGVPSEEGFSPRMLMQFLRLGQDAYQPGFEGGYGDVFEVNNESEGGFDYVTVKINRDWVATQLLNAMGFYNSPEMRLELAQTYTRFLERYSDEDKHPELTFTQVGTTKIEGETFAIWTQGDKPRVPEAKPDTAKNSVGLTSLVPARQPAGA